MTNIEKLIEDANDTEWSEKLKKLGIGNLLAAGKKLKEGGRSDITFEYSNTSCFLNCGLSVVIDDKPQSTYSKTIVQLITVSTDPKKASTHQRAIRYTDGDTVLFQPNDTIALESGRMDLIGGDNIRDGKALDRFKEILIWLLKEHTSPRNRPPADSDVAASLIEVST